VPSVANKEFTGKCSSRGWVIVSKATLQVEVMYVAARYLDRRFCSPFIRASDEMR